MKLIYRMALRLSMLLIPLMAVWAVIFYFTMVHEINDETDDALARRSEALILKILGGEAVGADGSGDSWSVTEVSEEYAVSHPAISRRDTEIHVPENRKTEPARMRVTIFQDRDGQWHELRVAMPTFEREDLQMTVLRWVIALYALLLVTSVCTTLWVFRKSMQPLYALLDWLDRYKPGKKSDPVPDGSDINEFRKLSNAAQQAVLRFEKMLEQQKQFIGNASHELQTPLAVLQGRLEHMVDNSGMNEEMLAEASRMQAALNRIIRLNKTLLLLARIENGQFPESVEVDIAALIREQREMYAEIYADRNIGCSLDLPGSFVVRMNESLASVLASNLLKNAWVHSPEGGSIEIRLKDGTLDISNDGAAALDADHIFERFYKSGGREGSTGLGLALVRAVADSYGMSAGYAFSEGRHHFTISFREQE